MSRTETRRLSYDPALDGLRAGAVLAVVCFHFDLGFPMGYLGVSLFFTLSGFLITRLILDNLDDGSFSLARFYSRRIARLVPAAALVLAAVMIVDLIQPFFWGRADVHQDALAAALHSVNWWFVVSDRPYFESLAQPSPIQHFWSLSVEEQFYLVFPVLCTVVGRRGARKDRLLVVFSLVAVTSVAIGVILGPSQRSYFGTDTRAVELIGGALLGLLARSGTVRSDRRDRWGWALLVAVVVGWNLPLGEAWLFRGGLVLVTAVSCGLIVASARPGLLRSWLSHPVPVAIGRRSYVIYLVHWPLMLATSARVLTLASWERLLLRGALLVGITEVVHRLWEGPARRELPLPRRAFPAAAFSVCVLAALSLTVTASQDVGPVQTTTVLPVDLASRFDRPWELKRYPPPTPTAEADPELPLLVVRGDSTARYIGGSVSAWGAEEHRYRTVNLGAPGCAYQHPPEPKSSSVPSCPSLADEGEVARILTPESVVLFFGAAGQIRGLTISRDQFSSEIRQIVDAYRARGALVILVGPFAVPTWARGDMGSLVEAKPWMDETLALIAAESRGVAYSDGGGVFDGPRRADRALRPDALHVFDAERGFDVVDHHLGPALVRAHDEAADEEGKARWPSPG